VKNLFMIARSCGYTTHRDVAAAQVIRNPTLSGEWRFLDIKQNACGEGPTRAGNSRVKNLRDRKKGGKARL